MSIIDFKEIPPSNGADGTQDSYEQFAREFFHSLGFIIIDGPDRGPDGGRDILVEETRTGTIGTSRIRWLVSCKHFAHCGKAVGEKDENNISDRLTHFGCKGFIGFYSTIVSSSLNQRLNALKKDHEILVFDKELIERSLIDNGLEELVKRFFPNSYKKNYPEVYKSVKLFNKYQPLNCCICGKDLLHKNCLDNYQGIIVYVINESKEDSDNELISSVYVACKGACDYIARQDYSYSYTKWEDISDLVIPTKYISFIMSFINTIQDPRYTYSNESFEEVKFIILKLAQLVMRETSNSEIERLKDLGALPDWL